jgi:c-di-GMP-binding flagellar brake protein YcgR
VRATQTIIGERRDDVLEDSINRRLRTTVTQSTPDGWRTFKSNFMSGDRVSRKILLKLIVPEQTSEKALPQPGESLGVTFRMGHKKCMFNTRTQASIREGGALLVTVSWPDDLEQLQRRAYERVAPLKDVVVPVRFWQETPGSTGPKGDRKIRHGQLENISAGGMRLKTGDLTDIEIGSTYRCVFAPQPGAPTVIVDAVLRHREATDGGRASLGFHVLGLETSREGRAVLDQIARVVRHFQRAKQRRRNPREDNRG